MPLSIVHATLSLRAATFLADPVGGGSASGGTSDAPQLDPVQLVLHASIPVKAVLVLLVAFSVACWLVIGAKALHLARARGPSRDRFIQTFDAGASFDAVAQGLGGFRGLPLRAHLRRRLRRAHAPHGRRARRALNDAQSTHIESVTRRAASREVTHLESWMSAPRHHRLDAPFIGLFGTVYGIMDAFLSIGNQQNANLPVVAPKIAEALIATAVGLVAAIPARHGVQLLRPPRAAASPTSLEGFAADVAARARLGGIDA